MNPFQDVPSPLTPSGAASGLWEPMEETIKASPHEIKLKDTLANKPGMETIGFHCQYFMLTFDGWGKVARGLFLMFKDVELIYIWVEVARKTITLLGIIYLLGLF